MIESHLILNDIKSLKTSEIKIFLQTFCNYYIKDNEFL